MKVKTNFKQMVLVDHLLYNKLDSISKPDVHVQHVRKPIINSFPPNHILPPTSPPSNVAPPLPNYSAPPIAPISEPSQPNSLHVPNNEWETQAHQWIDTFQQPNYVNYMDKSVQMEDNSNTAQIEPLVYTNTPQRAVIRKIPSPYTQPSATALPQKSFEQQMEMEYNQTPSIANEIKKAVEQEKRLHIEYAPPLPSIYDKPKNHNNVQQRDHFSIIHQPPQKEQQMELDYYTPRSITHTTTPMTISTLDPTPLALPSLPAPPTLPTPTAPLSLAAPATFRSLPAPPTVPSLPTPRAPRAPLSLTHAPTSVRDFSKNEECDECTNTVEYERKLPITYETNASKAMVPYNDYISIGARPEVNKKKVFYTCTRCNTNFTKQSSLINHNKRFHAAFEQTEKGLKRKPKGEVMPYGVPLMKQQKMRGVKRRYKQNSGSNKEIVPYKPYVLEKTT